ncbi:MAG: DEAD/DEAH box helicase [Saprospiraceae bacterium]|nr:DEAD/DEAH box helicase [Saprospiraceae bacterium]
MKFSELKIAEPLLKALSEKGYTTPTPIQQKAIPSILERKDILGCAQTGTGKTAAFAIPIIQQINAFEKFDRKPLIRALIVTPTRELAIQIDENIKAYSKHTSIRHSVIFGGVKQGKQVDQLKRGVHILTATPGRLLDLIDQGFISLKDLKIFVLDEADRMLDMGFINDIKKLLKIIPEKRQSLFFSATMPDNIVKLSNTILNNPIKIEVTPVSSTAETIKQFVYYTNRTSKPELLLHIIKERNIEQVLIFTRTKHGADRVARRLTKQGVKASSIHGDKAQNQRQKALKMFKEGDVRVLVATDIAARGIDIDKLQYVINYEVPNMPETYVHRIGRSGRAGENGTAISMCEPEENIDLTNIQKLIGNKIEVAENEKFPQTDKPMTEAEKKEWQKEKQRRKQEFFANRKAGKEKRGGGKSSRGGNNRKNTTKKKQTETSQRENRNEGRRKDTDSKPAEHSKTNHSNQENKSSQKPSSNRRSKNSSNKSKRRFKSTDASDKLKNKFMWPLE